MFSRELCEAVWETAIDDVTANGDPRIARTLLAGLIYNNFRAFAPEYTLLKQWPIGSYIASAGVKGDAEQCWISVHFYVQEYADGFLNALTPNSVL